ncbi:hypothetical protein [Parafilimonas sp.]|uniref:hypothetical protein n=1 Tax=Parafilimonas sp. TaxID=1969739 RepID=UPI0039E51D25
MTRFLFVLIALLLSFNLFSQPTFYVQNGNSISKVENGDPSQVNVNVWQVRLYKKGIPKSGNNYWGTIEGNSADDVMQKLKIQQEYELKINSFFGKGRVQDDILTHFNALGPIAITDASTSSKSTIVEKTDETSEVYNKAGSYVEAFLEAKKRLDVILKGKPVNPYDNYGSVLKEYAFNLKDAVKQVISLRTSLVNNTSITLDRISQQIASIDQKLEIANNNQEKLNTLINENQNKNNSNETVTANNLSANQFPFSSVPNKYKTAIQTVLNASDNQLTSMKAAIPSELTTGMSEQQKNYFKKFIEDVQNYGNGMALCFGYLSPGAYGYGYLSNNQIQIDETDQYYRDNVLRNAQIFETSNYNTYYSGALLEKGNAAYDLFKLLDSDPTSNKTVKNKILQYGIENVSMIYQQSINGYQDASVVKDKQVLLAKLKQSLK